MALAFDEQKRLTAEIEQALFARIQRGDRTASDELMRLLEPFAVFLAGLYRRLPVPFDDLVQMAYLASLKGIKTFNPNLGLRLTNHISWQYKSEVRDTLRSHDRLYRSETTRTKRNFLEPRDANAHADTMDALRESLKTLDARERDILTCRYGLNGSQPMSQSDTAKSLSKRKSTVADIEKSALAKLKAFIGDR